MAKRLQQVILFGVPILVGLLNMTHPMFRPPVYPGIVDHIAWWNILHILNLVLFPLLGLAAYLLVREVHNVAASLSRIAIAIFVPIYAAFDALAGIGTGILVQNAKQLAPNNLTTVGPLIDAYWNSGALNAVAAAGSIAWVIAMLSTSVAVTAADRRLLVAAVALVLFFVGGWAQTNLFLASRDLSIPVTWWLITVGMGIAMFVVGKPRIPATLLVLSASLFGASHVMPTGPLGMLCFLGAVLYREFGKDKL